MHSAPSFEQECPIWHSGRQAHPTALQEQRLALLHRDLHLHGSLICNCLAEEEEEEEELRPSLCLAEEEEEEEEPRPSLCSAEEEEEEEEEPCPSLCSAEE